MFHAIGNISENHKDIVIDAFERNELKIKFVDVGEVSNLKPISFDKKSSAYLNEKNISFYNWDLLFSVLGPNDTSSDINKKLNSRIEVLKAVHKVKSRPIGDELHGSIRVSNLAESTHFYSWLFGVEPKEWTHRYVTFVKENPKFNFVLLVSDGKELNHDTLYHLGMGVKDKQKVIEFYHSAKENGLHIEKPPRTTWRGTPLHELWLKDPDGTLIEIYARLSTEELAEAPDDKEPVFLT